MSSTRPLRAVKSVSAVAVLAAVAALAGCASGGSTASTGSASQSSTASAASGATSAASVAASVAASSPAAAKVKVVAATSWEGGLAKAAGATDITVIAPANLTHAPDYDPKPADLAAVAGADYVLYADFEGFAGKLKEATGSSAKLVAMNLENSPKAVRAEVTRLAGMFGTTDAATAWLTTFDARYAELSAKVKAAQPATKPVTVSQAFMGYWATDFAGLQVAGVYGPKPVTATELKALTDKKPGLIVANAHMPGDPEIPGAAKVTLVNYPGEDLDMLGVFTKDADLLVTAFKGLS